MLVLASVVAAAAPRVGHRDRSGLAASAARSTTRPAANLELPTYFEVAVLFLGLMVLGYLSSRRGQGRKPILRRAGSVLISMALFVSASFVLFTALVPAWTTAGQGLPALTQTPPASTAVAQAPEFTVPASADVGMNIIPNILDPQAVDPQHVCPGYKASNVQQSDTGLTADLHLNGPACNVYGNDIEDLTLLVRFQADNRLHIQIQPRYIGPENQTWFLLPEELVPRPSDGSYAKAASRKLDVTWSNDPSFSFAVKRKDTGDVLFTTEGRPLVFEDQFIEFGSSLPENYNLYGLGEVIHGFRLGNNLTSKYP
jgi:alpha-glucosidase